MSDLKERLGKRLFNRPHEDFINPDGPAALAYIADLEAKLAVAREALGPLAKLKPPRQTTGNCGAYVILFSDIEKARTALNTMGEDHG